MSYWSKGVNLDFSHRCEKLKQMVRIIRQKAASPLHTNRLIVFSSKTFRLNGFKIKRFAHPCSLRRQSPCYFTFRYHAKHALYWLERKALSTPITLLKQHCPMLQVKRFFGQSRTLLWHCCCMVWTGLNTACTRYLAACREENPSFKSLISRNCKIDLLTNYTRILQRVRAFRRCIYLCVS